jgi:hypothetical protein
MRKLREIIWKGILVLSVFFILSPDFVLAADNPSLALTITPPLMKINIEPGENLATAIKVVNNNDYPITVYAKTLDFTDNGFGEIKFINDSQKTATLEDENIYLSQWISLSQDRQDLQPFQTAIFSFSIDVPVSAAPGGHYAAILVGTNPPNETVKGAEVKVSSYLSSLILARVAGAIEEKGAIREFTFANRVYQGGEGNFRVRFDNLGNVHLAPTGNIQIFDMFGKKKGDIPVNVANDNSGNVLPKGERTWNDLHWVGDDFLLINRYRAELSLSFGDEAKQTEFSTFFFWGVNWRFLAIIGGSLLVLLVLIILFVRFYIRQSVKDLEKQFQIVENKKEKRKSAEEKVVDLRKKK